MQSPVGNLILLECEDTIFKIDDKLTSYFRIMLNKDVIASLSPSYIIKQIGRHMF